VHTHILCKHKLLFWMRFIAINRLTVLIINDSLNTIFGGELHHMTSLN